MDGGLVEDFHAAAQAGDAQLVERLLEISPELAAAPAAAGGNALHCAALGRHAAVIQLLLRAGVSPALPDAQGRTPLAVAALFAERDEDAAAARLLLDAAPAAALVPDSEGWLPLHLAACAAHPGVAQLLLDAAPDAARRADSQGSLPIHVAVQRLRRAAEGRRRHALEVACCLMRCAACDTPSLVRRLQIDS